MCCVSNSDGSVKTVAGSPVDRRSKAVETVVVQEKGNPRSFAVSFLDSGTEVSETSRDAPNMDLSEDVPLRQPNFDDTGTFT